MFSFQRVHALVSRHLLLFWQMNRFLWLFYWPALDMFLFGLSGVWIQKNQPEAVGIEISTLAGVVFWQLLARASFEVSICLIEELWALNLLNIFATPLLLTEFVAAVFVLASIMCTIVTLYCLVLVWLIYGINLFVLTFWAIPFLIGLFFSGIALGFFAASIIIYFGIGAESLVWMLNWLFAPFCGALYPVEILPSWAQAMSYFLPMTPAFEGIRFLIKTNQVNSYYVMLSLVMSVCYCLAAITYFVWSFHKSKERGFARLTVS